MTKIIYIYIDNVHYSLTTSFNIASLQSVRNLPMNEASIKSSVKSTSCHLGM